MEPTPNQLQVRLQISGRVQGVYYRASTVIEARRLGVTGWVMNCPNGTVEVVAEGPRSKLEDLVAWCRQGPPGAQVHHVESQWGDATSEYSDFRIKR